MNDLLYFGTDCKYMFFISEIFLKYNIDGVCVPQLRLDYIHHNLFLQINIRISCVNMFTICCGITKSWNYKSGMTTRSLKIKEYYIFSCWCHSIILWDTKNMQLILLLLNLDKALKKLIGLH